MNKQNLTKISKFLSYVLRHKPEEIGLQLNSEGWAKISELIAGAERKGYHLNTECIYEIVATNDKKRFALSEDRQYIRAVQGHSTNTVDITFAEKTPPKTLYHGTASRNIDAIFREGLKPGSRQYVHLSDNTEIAKKVGMRYGKPVILKIDTEKMCNSGHIFYQAENKVWLTKAVPTEYISILDIK
ncbi:RNA 2'-phosphotransferase [Suttonella ornithocola]|uniref:Probable RNA 2'-phosphotransferase n=1 Tax=Suttonella ornithocola TaxID=279832 RepID=A0A380MX75_9GAMM|nr:RNA 2'-phosphotransferase [Suttonella ornithocola]SUO97200.1 RNA 2'-phosphotransferase [Suttonella ornithocola]